MRLVEKKRKKYLVKTRKTFDQLSLLLAALLMNKFQTYSKLVVYETKGQPECRQNSPKAKNKRDQEDVRILFEVYSKDT